MDLPIVRGYGIVGVDKTTYVREGEMELQSLNHRHDAIVEWLVCNPDKTLGECARVFNYTLPWVSQMVHSDMFQAEYKKLCADRKVAAVHTITAKMSAAASLALDRTIEKLQEGMGVSDRFLTDTTGQMLDKLGYGSGPAPAGAQNHLHMHLTAEDLKDARNRAMVENTQ